MWRIKNGYLTGVALEAPDVVLLVQRHERLPVLEVLRAARAPVVQRAPSPSPVRRLHVLRPARLGHDVRLPVPVGLLLLPVAVPVGRGGHLAAFHTLLTKALLAGEGHPLA